MKKENNIKYCECGCGEVVKKGNRYIQYHHMRVNNPMNSQENRDKVSKAKMGHNVSQETRNKITETFKDNGGHPWKGKTLSKEHKNNISKANKGKKRSDEARENISLAHIGIQAKENHPMWGKKHSEETKWKISIKKKGFKHSEETKKKMRESRIGEKNFFWEGGISFSPYSSDFNKSLKLKIKERDNYTCQHPECEFKDKHISCHHIDYDKLNNNTDNLICLCSKHHGQTNSYRTFWENFYKDLMAKRKENLIYNIYQYMVVKMSTDDIARLNN